MPRLLCTLIVLAPCVPPTASYYYTSSAFGAKIVPGTNLYRMEWRSSRPVPNASKRQHGNVNLGLPRPLFGETNQGSQCEICSGGWWCKGPSKEVDRRRLGEAAPRQISRLSGRSSAEVGHIRSCCQGWTGLEARCKERGHVAPGVRKRERRH